MENLIAQCWIVQEKLDLFVYPVIYLKEPITNHDSQILHGFHNPFDAKNFIRSFMTDAVCVTVSKEAPSEQLSLARS
jgi:hypothetical protein